MKRFSVFLCSLVLVLGLAGAASALTFTETKDLDLVLGEGPVVGIIVDDSITYSHSTPSDFQVPYDTVNSATLTILGYWIDGNNDTVEVEGTAVGTLNTGGSYGVYWSWSSWSFVSYDNPSVSAINIASIFTAWSGDSFDVTITADGGLFDGVIELASSTFKLDYENNSAPVPEPATMLLLGTGLMGLAAAKRKRMLKK